MVLICITNGSLKFKPDLKVYLKSSFSFVIFILFYFYIKNLYVLFLLTTQFTFYKLNSGPR